jgi:serine/threonine protein kinase
MTPDCPPDDQLLALATDEPGSAAVREHVEHCAECQKRVESLCGEIAELRSLSALAAGSPLETVDDGAAATSLPNGISIGRYVIVGTIGSGGQADVYRVIDPHLGRDLVVKLSRRRSVEGDGQRDALRAEGRLLAQLDHPGLIRIFEIGIHNDRPFLALDYVPGRNLEQIYADKRPSFGEAARLIAEVARVVAYAHKRGVVHGDITPRNILIDDHGCARLIDFGLSKIEDAWGEDAGAPGGTPAFLPPEIAFASDDPGNSLPSSDVFGLGATLFWLLTGDPPFGAPTTLLALARSRRCDIDFAALQRARVPQGLARICRQALAADPSQRPAPDVFADELLRASRRRLTPRFVAGVIVAAAICAGLFWLAKIGRSNRIDDQNAVQSVPAIEIFRPDGIRNLSNELPLQTGDRVAIWCDISRGHDATMLWFNAAGELKRFSPVREVFEKVDRLYYPARHRSIALEPPEGTELIFFCRSGKITEEELQACFPVGTPLARLPAQNWLILRRFEATIEGPLSGVLPQEISAVEEVMKDINRKLRLHFKGTTAIAFPHYPADETK